MHTYGANNEIAIPRFQNEHKPAKSYQKLICQVNYFYFLIHAGLYNCMLIVFRKAFHFIQARFLRLIAL